MLCFLVARRDEKRTKNNLIRAVLLDHINLQIIKIDFLHKGIPVKSCPCVAPKIPDCGIEPHRYGKIKLHTGLFQCPEHFVGPGVVGGIFDYRVLEKMVILPFSHP